MLYVDDDDIALLAQRDVAISHCPSAALKHVKGLFAHGRSRRCWRRASSVSLGGDSANGSNHFDMLRLMYLAALAAKDAQLDPARAAAGDGCSRWRRCTARARSGLGDEIGSLEPRQARRPRDLRPRPAGVAAAPRSRCPTWCTARARASVRTVMVDGRLVLDDRRVTTVDERGAAATRGGAGRPLPRARRPRRPAEMADDHVECAPPGARLPQRDPHT